MALILGLVFLLVIVGGFVLAVALTVNKSTRVAGAVLLSVMLGVGTLMALAAGAFVFRRSEARQSVSYEQFHQQALRDHEQAMRRAEEQAKQGPLAAPPEYPVPFSSTPAEYREHADSAVSSHVAPKVLVGVPSIVLLLAVAGVVALLINAKTRVVGVVVLVLGGGVMVIVVPLAFLWLKTSTVVTSHSPTTVAHSGHPRASETPPVPPPNLIPMETAESPSSTTPTAEAKPDEPKPDEKTAESKPAASRPEWVGMKPQVVDGGYRMSATVGPYSTALECDQQTPAAIRAAFDEYVGVCLGDEWAGRILLPGELRRQSVVKQQWEETVNASFGPMVQVHLLLEFDRKLKDKIQQAQTRAIVSKRLWTCAFGLGGLLTLLGMAYAGLKIDLATGGRYRGRLVLAAAAITALLIAATMA